MKLRPYQDTAMQRFLNSKTKSMLMVAPTGAGKGTMASWLMARYAREKRKVLFLVHRRELVHDMTRRLRARGVPVVQSVFSTAHVRVISVQAAMRLELQPVDLLVIDEAHHYAADEWQRVMNGVRAKRIIGFTATPERADGRALGDMFDQIVEVASYSNLLAQGVIVPCRVLRPQRRMLSDEIAQDPVDAYLRYARGQRCLIYVRRVAEAEAVRDLLLARGVRAGAVHGGMSREVRDRVMQQLEDGDLDVVANVRVLTEGIDVPHVTHLILGCPCSHASMYLQIVGRALRAAPGKDQATLIDLVGASYKHGLPAEDRLYALEGEAIRVKDRDKSSGPSGPRGDAADVENMELDLVEVPAMTSRQIKRWREEEIQKTRAAEREARVERAKARKQELRAEIREARQAARAGADQARREAHQKELEERRAELERLRQQDAAPVLKPGNRWVETKHRMAPKQRPMPALITEGFLFEDKGFWNLGYRELGKAKRMGLGGTKNRAQAEELLTLFREKGLAALEERVLQLKRKGASLVTNNGSRPFYLHTWSEDKRERIKVHLSTRDRARAEAIRDLWLAGKLEQARALIAENERAMSDDTRARRSASLRRQWAARHAAAE